jgi:hypothetical protein
MPSISACIRAIGFGCWKNGCGVLYGADRKTTRRGDDARRSMTAAGEIARHDLDPGRK